MKRDEREAQVRERGGYVIKVRCENCNSTYEQRLPRGMRFGSVAHTCDVCGVDLCMVQAGTARTVEPEVTA